MKTLINIVYSIRRVSSETPGFLLNFNFQMSIDMDSLHFEEGTGDARKSGLEWLFFRCGPYIIRIRSNQDLFLSDPDAKVPFQIRPVQNGA